VETWKPVAPVSFVLGAIETMPQRSNRISRSEAVLAISMELCIAGQGGSITLVVPANTLKRIHQQFHQYGVVPTSGSRETVMAIRRWMSRELFLDLDCDLLGARIRLSELQALKVGDVICLGISADSPVTLTVGGVPRFKAAITPLGSRMAVTVESTEAD
jgi:flagellar motor switch protein FliM